MSVLKLDRVTVLRRGRKVLDGNSATFQARRVTAVIGPNGAGKSTMLNAAAGLLQPDAGRVTLDGADISRLHRRELARRRAYLPQRADVDWPITVERVVALGLAPQLPAFGPLPQRFLPAIEGALASCDVGHLRERPANALSGGELARVMLARTFVSAPELLIVDEPTAGLDPRHAIDAMRRLRARAREGCTVIVAIHDLDLALNHADDLVAIRDGAIMAAGPIESAATPALLNALYGVPVRLVRDSDGTTVRFLSAAEAP